MKCPLVHDCLGNGSDWWIVTVSKYCNWVVVCHICIEGVCTVPVMFLFMWILLIALELPYYYVYLATLLTLIGVEKIEMIPFHSNYVGTVWLTGKLGFDLFVDFRSSSFSRLINGLVLVWLGLTLHIYWLENIYSYWNYYPSLFFVVVMLSGKLEKSDKTINLAAWNYVTVNGSKIWWLNF